MRNAETTSRSWDLPDRESRRSLNLLGCLDTPTKGRYVLNGRDVSSMDEDELAVVPERGDRVRVFKRSTCFLARSALKNVEAPPRLRRRDE